MAPAQVRSLQCRCDYLAELDPVHGGLPQFAPECLLPEPLQCGACANSPLPSSHVHASSHKHSRRVEDVLWKANLDIAQRVTLLFSKESSRQGSDKRPLTQTCISPFASKNCKWQDSEAHQTGVLGPLPILRVSEMVGYDPDSGMRPGAAARMEQTLGLNAGT